MSITEFRGKHRFLSNFWPCSVTLDGEVYPSVEHAYVAAKVHDPVVRRLIRDAATAGDAKRLGRKLPLREGWDLVKHDVMRQLIQQKFADPHLAELLLETGEQELVEGNSWGDVYWGVCNGVGENRLGKLLMEAREALKSGCCLSAQRVQCE